MSCETFKCSETIGLMIRPDTGIQNSLTFSKPIRPVNIGINFKLDGSSIIDGSFSPTWHQQNRAIFTNGSHIPISNLSTCPGYLICSNNNCDDIGTPRFLGTLTWKAIHFGVVGTSDASKLFHGDWPSVSGLFDKHLTMGKTTKQLGLNSNIDWYLYVTWTPDGCAKLKGFRTSTKSKLVKVNWVN